MYEVEKALNLNDVGRRKQDLAIAGGRSAENGMAEQYI